MQWRVSNEFINAELAEDVGNCSLGGRVTPVRVLARSSVISSNQSSVHTRKWDEGSGDRDSTRVSQRYKIVLKLPEATKLK